MTPEEIVVQWMFYVGLAWALCFLFNMAGRLFASLLNRLLS